jgi:hypothetical protein
VHGKSAFGAGCSASGRHFEISVIEHRRKVVSRNSVGPKNYQVVKFAVIEDGPALDQIFNHGLSRSWRAEANCIVTSGGAIWQSDLRQLAHRCTVAATAVVAWLPMLTLSLFSHRPQFFSRTIARVSLAFLQQLGRTFAVAIEPIRLKILRVRGTVIPIDTQPAQAFENLVQRFLGRAPGIGVIDA